MTEPSTAPNGRGLGRAGRAIERAYGVMLSGGDDRDINDYFIEEAFPPEGEVLAILNALEQSAHGLTMPELEAAVKGASFRLENPDKVISIASIQF